jgi:hypothetical protein
MNIASTKLLIKRILNYNVPGKYAKIKPDDVFLVSYPKSGNTWLRFLLGNLIYENKMDFINMNKLMPDIYASYKHEIDRIKRSPRFIKSHESYTPSYPKVIYIYRDPRDVVISYFYWYKKFKKGEYSNFNKFFNDYINGNVAFGRWNEHVKGWKNAALEQPDKVLIISYENLKSDTYKEFYKIINFCELKPSEYEIKKAISLSEFSQMRKLEEVQGEKSYFKNTDLKIKFVRSGKSEWKEKLSEEQLEIILSEFVNEFPEFQ